ncbi:TetR/AcrR family transcriptional regulator [Clostridiaceae bacterium M8S5]|nr:TetR/AcrR family transcriptional regulator [Clostridiaceae bacterium M8S5]
MNNSFFKLPKEKQTNLFYAGCKVFANNTYKKASMSKVANEAGISKSLLFYYFKNKKEYYLFILEHVIHDWNNYLFANINEDETYDLFDKVIDIIKLKQTYIKKLQLYYKLFKRIYYEKEDSLTDDLKRLKSKMKQPYEKLYKLIDKSKFKDEQEIKNCVEILLYFAQGQLVDTEIDSIDEDVLVDKFKQIVSSLRRNYYKEEYNGV